MTSKKDQTAQKSTALQVKLIGELLRLLLKAECQFPSLETATSQLSQIQFGALLKCSIPVSFSEI